MHLLRSTSLAALVLSLAASLGSAALAESFDATSRMDSVVVYADRAQITRTASVDLPAGSHSIRIEGLPATLVERSVRIAGQGTAGLVIGRVGLERVEAADLVQPAERELREAIFMLENRRAARADAIRAEELKLDMIEAIGKGMSESAADGAFEGEFDPTAWLVQLDKLKEATAAGLAQIRLARQDMAEIDKQIAQKKRELEQLATGARTTITAVIEVESEAAQTADITLDYQIGDAGWTPLYELRLDSEAGSVELVREASIRQGTGEAWEDVALTLSTARPSRLEDAPELDPWFIDVVEPMPAPAPTMTRSLMRKVDPAAELAAGAPMMAADHAEAELVESPFETAFAVPGRASVAADRTPEIVRLASNRLEADLRARVVPQLRAAAWLVADVTLPDGAPVLPGTAALFRDGTFIGESRLPFLAAGSTQSLSFGIDEAIEVEFRLDTGQRSQAGIINSYRRQERRFITTVTNRHGRPVPVTVLDRLPVPQDERIEVELLDGTPPDRRDVDDKRGLLAWDATLEPNAAKTIRFGYAVEYPEGLIVPGF